MKLIDRFGAKGAFGLQIGLVVIAALLAWLFASLGIDPLARGCALGSGVCLVVFIVTLVEFRRRGRRERDGR